MQNRKNAIIAVLVILVVALGVLLFVTNADKGNCLTRMPGLRIRWSAWKRRCRP
jgi:hypothetical protein